MYSFAFIAVMGSWVALLFGVVFLRPGGPQMGAPVPPVGLFLLVAAGTLSLCGCIAASLVLKTQKDRFLKLTSIIGYLCLAFSFGLIVLGH
jgi:hypothetical protein